MMKDAIILFSISYKAPNGASSFVRSFVGQKNFFENKDINLSVFSRDNYQQCDFSNAEVIARRHKIKTLIWMIIDHIPILTILYDYFMESRTARKVVKEFYEQNGDRNVDVIHCQEDNTCYYLLKHKPTSKVIVTFHSDGSDFDMLFSSRPGFNSRVGRKYLNHRLNYILQRVDGIGFVSRSSMELFAKNHPDFCAKKLFYVYNGIPSLPLTHDYSPKERIQFICVGSLCARKNQMALIEAIALLPDNIKKQMELLLVGDGPSAEEIRNYVLTHSIDNVILKGSCTNVAELLKKADVFILASKSEGLPISIIEAMREGLPIIGSDVAGIPEMIEDGNSGYITGTDAKSISESIVKMILLSDEDRKKFGQRSYNLFKEKFCIESMFDAYAYVYNKMVSTK